MTKYNGIKVVESSVNEAKNTSVEKKEGGGFFVGFFMRIMLAALILVTLFTLKNTDNPSVNESLNVVKSAVTYDINKRDDSQIGHVKFLELFKKLLGNSDTQN